MTDNIFKQQKSYLTTKKILLWFGSASHAMAVRLSTRLEQGVRRDHESLSQEPSIEADAGVQGRIMRQFHGVIASRLSAAGSSDVRRDLGES